MWAVSKDSIGRKLFLCFVLLSPPLNSGLPLHLLLAAGHFSSFTDPFSMSLISVLVYEHLVTACQIQKEDINSSCFGTLTLSSICPRYRFLCLVISSSLSLSQSPTTHSTASPITSAAFLFFPSESSIFSAACGSVSPLSDTEMMQKDKTIWGKPILLCLSLFRRLAASDSCLQVFLVCVCVFSVGGGGVHTGSCQTVDSHSSPSSGPRPALFTRCRHHDG